MTTSLLFLAIFDLRVSDFTFRFNAFIAMRSNSFPVVLSMKIAVFGETAILVIPGGRA